MNKYTGRTKIKGYRVWHNMLLRCASDHPAHFSKYKARGITVCARWLVFENFLADMGEPPAGLTLDRIDNNGVYEPGNCRWADRKTQQRNRRYVRPLTFNGKTQLISDWATELGINVSTLNMRIDSYGWSVERALTERVHHAL